MRPPYWVYVLLLEGNRIYVGFTSDLHRRWGQHVLGKGALCTRPYRAIRLVETLACPSLGEAKELETSVYYTYRDVFGSARVRGAGCTRRYRPASAGDAYMASRLAAPWLAAEA